MHPGFTPDKESKVTEKETPYKKVRMEDAITDLQTRDSLSTLNAPWRPQRARFQIASRLAYGILVLFGFIIVLNGTTVAILACTNGSQEEVELISSFAKIILPYLVTPLGIALGYFFREDS